LSIFFPKVRVAAAATRLKAELRQWEIFVFVKKIRVVTMGDISVCQFFGVASGRRHSLRVGTLGPSPILFQANQTQSASAEMTRR